ncbi:MAG: WecB/TagA/CpsF family glycosyltransferase [Pseudomonadota bacterium]
MMHSPTPPADPQQRSPDALSTMHLLGFEIAKDPGPRVVEDIARWVLEAPQGEGEAGRGKRFACINPHSYAEIKKRPELLEGFLSSDWIVPDGAGIVLASRFVGDPVAERITGADIFFGLNAKLEKAGKGRVFFLGSTQATLDRIADKFRKDYPNLELAGTYSPPYKPEFTPEDKAAMVAAVNAAKPDVLWVGMTAPKQEAWIAEHIDQLDIRFAGAIGAVFDFYIGNVKRSSPVWQNLHLEWLPRLVQEPRRLWRRMLISAPIFVTDVVRERLGRAGGRR